MRGNGSSARECVEFPRGEGGGKLVIWPNFRIALHPGTSLRALFVVYYVLKQNMLGRLEKESRSVSAQILLNLCKTRCIFKMAQTKGIRTRKPGCEKKEEQREL